MPLEACVIILDNSEWSRNGDYAPDRFGAQTDAVSVIFNAKTGANPENTVGLMSMAGQSPQVLATLTHDYGKMLSGLKKADIGGTCDFVTALNVAQLALKHRENKNQRQRIVAFVGSPIVAAGANGSAADVGTSSAQGGVSEETLVKLAKKLKKNNVSVDVVTFGEEGHGNEQILGKFIETVDANESSHLVSIPAGSHLMSDMISRSAVLSAERAARGGGGGGGSGGAAMAVDDFAEDFGGAGAGDDFGIDPDMDPELAMAIRLSMQEEEERQRRAAGATAVVTSSATQTEAAATTAPAAQAQTEPATTVSAEGLTHPGPTDTAPASAAGNASEVASNVATEGTDAGNADQMHVDPAGDAEDDDEDEEMLRAIAMSLEKPADGTEKKD